MNVSVVVPAFNEEKIIARSLAAMQQASGAFDSRGWSHELVVSNNNSTDRTAELAEAAGARVVFEPINQISRARNKGGFAARGDWLIFVDADSFPSEALFGKVADLIERGQCLGGGCLIRMDERIPSADWVVSAWNLASRVLRWAAGSFIFCEAQAFRELGGFSDQIFASEEIDFSIRLKKLARQRKKRFTIISDERLVTSARKMHLYKKWEHLRFFARAVLARKKVISNRDECTLWYDGRR